MNIVFMTPEVVPFSKTGGLADVSGALPIEIAQEGHNVVVYSPLYKSVDTKRYNIVPVKRSIFVPISGRMESVDIYESLDYRPNPRIRFLFLSCEKYFKREFLYGEGNKDYPDNHERFGLFSRSVFEALKSLNFVPDIIHCNDWQTGIVPVYLKCIYFQDSFFSGTKSLITIHNMAYQGLFESYTMDVLMLPWSLFNYKELEYYGKINFLKAGIVFADAVTTVSKKYAEEIRTQEYGCGLEGVLEERKNVLYGILNGVDYSVWDPSVDSLLPQKYSIKDLSGKKECKKSLLKKMGLDYSDNTPVIGIISRLADQKGFDLLFELNERLVNTGAKFVILGTGDKKYHEHFIGLKNKSPDRIGLLLGFDNALAHLIEAGSDFFLMPSKYEPCGLNQMYSLRYGTFPIVRGVGGLDDTIIDLDLDKERGNGFKFYNYNPEELLKTIERALRFYREEKDIERYIKRIMELDFSWTVSAKKYTALYEKLLGKDDRISQLF
ncbi:MAG: glycogen synthase GlgA [Deltaproteobacteria bacterium]|nr:glycogen synthase GlgA [Deltaproteobacteria bacterium]